MVGKKSNLGVKMNEDGVVKQRKKSKSRSRGRGGIERKTHTRRKNARFPLPHYTRPVDLVILLSPRPQYKTPRPLLRRAKSRPPSAADVLENTDRPYES